MSSLIELRSGSRLKPHYNLTVLSELLDTDMSSSGMTSSAPTKSVWVWVEEIAFAVYLVYPHSIVVLEFGDER